MNGLLGQDALEDRGDHRKGSGEVPGPPCGPRALSRPIISFEPPTRRWLAEAINALLGQEALQDKGEYRKGLGKAPHHPMGPRPDLRALSPLLSHLNRQRGDGGHRPSLVWWARRPLRTRGTIGNVPERSPRPPCGAQARP